MLFFKLQKLKTSDGQVKILSKGKEKRNMYSRRYDTDELVFAPAGDGHYELVDEEDEDYSDDDDVEGQRFHCHDVPLAHYLGDGHDHSDLRDLGFTDREIELYRRKQHAARWMSTLGTGAGAGLGAAVGGPLGAGLGGGLGSYLTQRYAPVPGRLWDNKRVWNNTAWSAVASAAAPILIPSAPIFAPTIAGLAAGYVQATPRPRHNLHYQY